jgi:hypothetical protein
MDTNVKLLSSQNFRGLSDTAVGKAHTVSQNIWRQLRSPFLLPLGCCGTCVQWEAIEYGKMGCVVCGSFHICCITTCPITEIENNHVCNITGAVVKTITYDTSEYLSTAAYDTQPSTITCKSIRRALGIQPNTKTSTSTQSQFHNSHNVDKDNSTHGVVQRIGRVVSVTPTKRHTVSRCINFHERICLRVLCSDTTDQCYEKEQVKLRNRLRWSFMRHVRAFKLRHRDMYPNCIVMLSSIATDIENYRLPVANSTDAVRKELARNCAQDIFRFTCSMTQSNALFTLNMDPTTMVIGLLYLLRSGLVHKNMTVLPQYRSLAYLLPPENYIYLFGVKSKIITECENIVKCHLRTLSDIDIKDIGYEAFDRLVH